MQYHLTWSFRDLDELSMRSNFEVDLPWSRYLDYWIRLEQTNTMVRFFSITCKLYIATFVILLLWDTVTMGGACQKKRW